MADCCSPTFLFVAIRAIHFAGCLILLALPAFDCFVLPAVTATVPERILKQWEQWETFTALVILPLIALSGIAWFAVVCMNMSGLALRDAIKPETVRAVWGQTQFGRVWQFRSIVWIGMGCMPISLRMPRFFRVFALWVNLILAGMLTASLAWAGHGQDGGNWHLAADAGHLVVAGFWPMGLVPFALFLFELRNVPSTLRIDCIATLTSRFSMMSVCGVMLLVLTGTINSIYLVGSISALFRSNYGRVLMLKLLLFLIMLSIGAVNRLWLKPALVEPISDAAADNAAAKLRRNVIVEILLILIVVVVTALLGLLAPEPT